VWLLFFKQLHLLLATSNRVVKHQPRKQDCSNQVNACGILPLNK